MGRRGIDAIGYGSGQLGSWWSSTSNGAGSGLYSSVRDGQGSIGELGDPLEPTVTQSFIIDGVYVETPPGVADTIEFFYSDGLSVLSSFYIMRLAAGSPRRYYHIGYKVAKQPGQAKGTAPFMFFWNDVTLSFHVYYRTLPDA